VAAAEPLPERRSLLAAALPFTQALLAQVGRTLARAQAALAWPEGSSQCSQSVPVPSPCAPLGDADLRTYLGPGGRLLRPHELRLHVFHGGVEPGLRKVAAAVRKDVVRTDRAHPYFGGPEEGHPHLQALQELLTTFALAHPRLSYCQGMSDVASPLLAVLDDEAQAYLCFC
ncbi:TBC25 protein, partial [Serilophus lunatus]|nr:TBC25 protein [Serilophus lunatus]